MKAGFIGYRNFAQRLKSVFELSGEVREFLFYHPEKDVTYLKSTRNFNDLLNCDFIVISSPDWTHGRYLRSLKDYEGYIFCEKIPVLNSEDLLFLKRHNNPYIYYDFNYRKSLLYDILKEHENEVLYVGHRYSVGIALREAYKSNWRSDSHKAPLGVFQLSGIHLFDLLIFCFGRPTAYNVSMRNISPYGDSVDNFKISMEFKNGIFSELFFSYTAPYQYSLNIVTTEKLFESDGSSFVVRGPRETLDENGLFSAPHVTSEKAINIYENSLKESVQYFLDSVKNRNKISESFMENNLLSTELFLEIIENNKHFINYKSS